MSWSLLHRAARQLSGVKTRGDGAILGQTDCSYTEVLPSLDSGRLIAV